MGTEIFYKGQEQNFLSFIETKNYSQHILLADANTNGFCVTVLKKIFPKFKKSSLIIIPKGEQSKTLEVCTLIWNELEKLEADKSCVLINIGGGMVSDMGGFAASVYKRGIAFINIPTTLLAMVDACYGGKTGIDFNGIKNNLGTFQHPEAIYINPIFLQTLNEKILRSGIAESIKHALLNSSNDNISDLQHYELIDFTSMNEIQKSLETKISFVAQDEKDQGIRQCLNLGHTLGHAIESYSLQTSTPLLHGEAIMLGLLHELRISEKMFQLSPSIYKMLEQLKSKFFPSLQFQYSYQNLKPFLIHDKKNNEGIRMSLLKEMGKCEIQVLVSEIIIQESFS